MKYLISLLIAGVILSGTTAVFAQIGSQPPVLPPGEPKTPVSENLHSGLAVQIMLTNFGFSVGGQYRHVISPLTEITASLRIGALKNISEQTITTIFGQEIPHKFNRAFTVPLMFGVRERLFPKMIEDNFRVHLSAAVGPAMAFVYPYFKDYNKNKIRDLGEIFQLPDSTLIQEPYEPINDALSGWGDGHLKWGTAGEIAISVDLGKMKNIGTLSFGYYFNYFPTGIQMLEPRQYKTNPQTGQRQYDPKTGEFLTTEGSAIQKYFGTPVISFTIGGMW